MALVCIVGEFYKNTFFLFSKMYILLLVILFCGDCASDSEDLGYSLHIGNAIDIFSNYGDLSQVAQVVSADYEEEIPGDNEPFREKNIKVFANVSSTEVNGDPVVDMNILLCDTFDDLLNNYFRNFKIEGTEKSWKAFMGDWIIDEILRTLGLGDTRPNLSDNCCFVLIKLTKTDKFVKLGSLKNVTIKPHVQDAITGLNVHNMTAIRKFMRSYGTHYIDSYTLGNFIYQVFKFKRSGFNLLKTYIKLRNNNSQQMTSENLRFYFSSYFLTQIGDIKIASSNKTVEKWARENLRDSQYLYSRPSLLRLHYNPVLAYKINDLLEYGALLSLRLKTLKPLFTDKHKADKFTEVVLNDMKLWEVNA